MYTGKKSGKDFIDIVLSAVESNELKGTKETFTDEDVVANAIQMLLAGFETTAIMNGFIGYYLSLNKHVQERLRQEITSAQGSEKKELSYETLTSLPYLDAFVKEVLRINPPVIRYDRVATEDVILDNGLKIDKGTVVRIPIFHVHHKEDLYPDHEKFNPDRFLSKDSDPYSFLTFALGVRNCIGWQFALMQAKLMTVMLVTKFKIDRHPDLLVPMEFVHTNIVCVPKAINLRITGI